MNNDTSMKIRNDVFILDEFIDEKEVERRLGNQGFNLEYTAWTYSWTVPNWVTKEKKTYIEGILAATDYKSYLISVREEVPHESI